MKILIGISGSIASYKSYDLTRELIKAGHEVKIILTKGALEFINPNTYRYLGAENVFLPDDDFNISLLKKGETVLHIELSKWADIFLIAPLSANTISRINLGLASDLLLSTILATTKPILLFPAMNTKMWSNQATMENLDKISKRRNFHVFNPANGLLACGDVGEGKLLEIETIKTLTETFSIQKRNKKVLITAGATVSPLDPVRYITNPSSGKMGLEVAKVFLKNGYHVTMLAGHNYTNEINSLISHPDFKLFNTPTTKSMKEMAVSLFPQSDLYISTAAIADFEFESSDHKLKKEKIGNTLRFNQAPDVLKEILQIKKPTQKVVSFAAETNTTKEVFQEKMNRKPVDLMVGNKVSSGFLKEEASGFQTSSGTYFFIRKDEISHPIDLTKYQVGEKILNWFENE